MTGKTDTLRHAFATYHAAHFRNLPELQPEMGHRDASLLRTHYINASYLNRQETQAFWYAACPSEQTFFANHKN